MKLNLSIIIVTYNCGDYINRFLSELFMSLAGCENFEILLNDNQSNDSTFSLCQKFADESVIPLVLSRSGNIGFAKANNMLIKRAKYDNILLLNPDVFGFYSSFWTSLITKWDKINPMFIRLLNEDLTIQENVGEELSLKRRFKRVLGNSVNMALSNQLIEVESGIMAFVLITKKCFTEVGLLSEEYFMYAEDHDWFFRARRKGFALMYEPSLELVHTGGGSAKSKWNNTELKKVKLAMEVLFIKKHFKGIDKYLLLFINKAQGLI